MGLFDRFKKSQVPQNETEQRSAYDEYGVGLALNYNGYSTYKTTQAMTLAAVHRCVTVIMNSVASLPVRLYVYDKDGYKEEVKNELSYLLGKKPNSKMNAYTFYSLIVKDILLSGNGYALILRKDGKIVGFQYVQAGLVSPIDMGTRVDYMVTGINGVVKQEDILHFMNYTDNGVYGISVLTHAHHLSHEPRVSEPCTAQSHCEDRGKDAWFRGREYSPRLLLLPCVTGS